MYAIIDSDKEKTPFFKNQQLLRFQKVWYYRDYVDVEKKEQPDINYLAEFEKKYGINLWTLAYGERFFYKYNERYFSERELLSILEQECKLFEEVLDEIKPDFLVLSATDYHHSELLRQISFSRKIRILMLTGCRFGYRSMITEEADRFDKYAIVKETNIKPDFEELLKFREKFATIKQTSQMRKTLKLDMSRKISRFFKAFFVYGGKDYRNHFKRKGLTRSKIFLTTARNVIKRWKTKRFLKRNVSCSLENIQSEKLIYYSLQSEPEKVIIIPNPFYMDQLPLVANLAKAIPQNYKLCIKDHPTMEMKGGRSSSFYKEIMNLPNVILLPSSISQTEIIKRSSLVITIAGTASLEAAFYNIPSLVFMETLYTPFLSSVKRVTHLDDLPRLVKESLSSKVNVNELKNFIDMIENNTFIVDAKRFGASVRLRFYDIPINDEEMASFMKEFHSELDKISSEYIKKIEETKNE